MKYYFAINWELDVIPLGQHEGFCSAERASDMKEIHAIYIASEESIKHLKDQLSKISL